MAVTQLSESTAAVVSDSAARQENRSDINRLEEENASLRAYLDRVLALLDTELPEPEDSATAAPEVVEAVAVVAPASTPPPNMPVESGPCRLLRLADIERRIKRTEETLEDLVWLVTRLEQEAASKLQG